MCIPSLVLIAQAVFLLESGQADRQTNKQTNATERPTHAGGIQRDWRHTTDVRTDRVVEVDVGAHGSLVNLHHWSIVVAHCYLRVAGVALHNFTHCFQLHTHTHTGAVLSAINFRLALRPLVFRSFG